MRLEDEKEILGLLLIGVGIFKNNIDCPRQNPQATLPKTRTFDDKRNRLIIKAMRGVNDSGEQINLTTVKEVLHRRGKLKKAGGVAYLTSLEEGVERGGITE